MFVTSESIYHCWFLGKLMGRVESSVLEAVGAWWGCDLDDTERVLLCSFSSNFATGGTVELPLRPPRREALPG